MRESEGGLWRRSERVEARLEGRGDWEREGRRAREAREVRVSVRVKTGRVRGALRGDG